MSPPAPPRQCPEARGWPPTLSPLSGELGEGSLSVGLDSGDPSPNPSPQGGIGATEPGSLSRVPLPFVGRDGWRQHSRCSDYFAFLMPYTKNCELRPLSG